MKCPKVHNKHQRAAPPDAIYIGRGSPWGNPFKVGRDGTREQVIARYEKEVLPTLDLSPLRGRDLVCFCAPLACHGDILIREANKEREGEG